MSPHTKKCASHTGLQCDCFITAPLRLWGVRHVRWWFKYQRVAAWCRMWGALCMSSSDQQYLDAVWNGKA